jgi:hypothetical protein
LSTHWTRGRPWHRNVCALGGIKSRFSDRTHNILAEPSLTRVFLNSFPWKNP